MKDIVCADCGKKAASKRREHYFYDYIIRLEEVNKKLLEACKDTVDAVEAIEFGAEFGARQRGGSIPNLLNAVVEYLETIIAKVEEETK